MSSRGARDAKQHKPSGSEVTAPMLGAVWVSASFGFGVLTEHSDAR